MDGYYVYLEIWRKFLALLLAMAIQLHPDTSSCTRTEPPEQEKERVLREDYGELFETH